MAKLFSLFGEIFIDNEKANKSIKDTTGNAKEAESGFSKVIGTAGKIGAAVITGTAAAAGAIGAFAVKTADTASRIDDMSQKLGMSRKGFQEWDYILKQNGTDIDSMGTAMKTMTNLMADGGKTAETAFGKLGLSVAEVQSMSQEDAFALMVERLQGMEDGAEKDALALDLFGKQAMELSPLLNSSADDVDNLRKKANDLGMVMSDDAVKSGEQFGDTLETLKGAAAGLMAGLGSALMPIVQKLADLIIANLPAIKAMLDNIMPMLVGFLAQALPMLMELAEQLLPVIFKIIEMLMPVLIALMPLFMSIVQALLPPLIDLLNMLLPPLLDLLNLIIPPLTDVIRILADVFGVVLKASIEAIKPIIEGITNVFRGLIDFVTGIFTGNWSQAWQGVVQIFSGIWQSIVGYAKAPLNFLIDMLNAAIRQINKIKIPDWVPGLGGKGINIPEIKKLKVGIDYVPYDNMPALLHEGERVLTKEENAQGINSGMVLNFNGPVTVRSDNDIKEIARELYRLQRREALSMGV